MAYRDYTLEFVVSAESVDMAVDILHNTPYDNKLKYIVNTFDSKEKKCL